MKAGWVTSTAIGIWFGLSPTAEAADPEGCWPLQDRVGREKAESALQKLLDAPIASRCPETAEYLRWRLKGYAIRSGTAEDLAYATALRSGDWSAYEAFLDRYPDGEYAKVFRDLMPSPPPPPPPPPSTVQAVVQGPEAEAARLAEEQAKLAARNAALNSRGLGPVSQRRFQDCDTCPEMVVVPAGRISLAAGAAGSKNVSIGAFAVGRFEISRQEFWRLADDAGLPSAPCSVPDQVTGEWIDQSDHDELRGFYGSKPSACVSLADAQAFIRGLNARVAGAPYRLLSEAEWEYVARAGSATRFWWGDDEGEACKHGNLADASALHLPKIAACSDGFAEASYRGEFGENALGVADMAGNVWERTADCYNPTYANTPADGSPATAGNCSDNVIRGGSWTSEPRHLASGAREPGLAGGRYANLGFRVARKID